MNSKNEVVTKHAMDIREELSASGARGAQIYRPSTS